MKEVLFNILKYFLLFTVFLIIIEAFEVTNNILFAMLFTTLIMLHNDKPSHMKSKTPK